MALNQLELIIKETISKYGLHRVAVSHHIGTVPPLEAGVLGELSFEGSPDQGSKSRKIRARLIVPRFCTEARFILNRARLVQIQAMFKSKPCSISDSFSVGSALFRH